MNKIVKALLEGKLIFRTCKYIKQLWLKQWKYLDESMGIVCRRLWSTTLNIEPNKIVFMTYQNQYTCNPKYITAKLIQNEPNLKIVWIVDKATLQNPQLYGIPEQVHLVQRDSYQSFFELMTAKIWVDNALNCPWKYLSKKKNQVYLNTWHGSLGIKRLNPSGAGKRYWTRIARRSNHMIDYMFTNSIFENQVFHSEYWPDVELTMTGHARNDIFFNNATLRELRKKVLDYYDLEEDVKLLLYAPTFREDKNTSCFDMDYQSLYKTLTANFPGKWKILLRLHFHNKKTAKVTKDDFIIPATSYPDIQELMAAADIGITDYSSWIYDYMLTKRPCFIYASDIDLYNHQRGFYYPLEETPFAIAKTTQELCENMTRFDKKKYDQKVQMFLKEKGCMEDGHAAERICQIIKSIIEKCK